MAQNTTIDVPLQTWTLLTDTDVTSITFQNLAGRPVLFKGVAGAVTPSNTLGALEYEAGAGEVAKALADLWPGIAATRVYAICMSGPARVMVSHA